MDDGERGVLARLLAEARATPIDPERERELARTVAEGLQARERLEAGVPLEADERARLMELERAGRDAKDRLVTAHLPMVVAMARRYRWSPVPLLELVQEGSLGLLRAAERFDWRRGTPFAAYAAWWVRHAMSRAVRAATGGVRLSERTRRRLRSLAEARSADPEASDAVLGDAAGVTGEEAAALVPLLGTPIPLGVGAERDRLEELLADRRAEEELEEVLVSADVARLLAVAERVLSERERAVLEARYGLGGGEPQTLRQVAERLGVSLQRVAQIERGALDRLRGALGGPVDG
jgi:RNA polymerase primary sigma factor